MAASATDDALISCGPRVIELVRYDLPFGTRSTFVETLENVLLREWQQKGIEAGAILEELGPGESVFVFRSSVESSERPWTVADELEVLRQRVASTAAPHSIDVLLLRAAAQSRFDGLHGSITIRGAAVIDIRNYRTVAGAGDAYHRHFERNIIPAVERYEGWIPAYFRHVRDPDRLLWLWAFEDEEIRETAKAEFYGGPEWRELREPTLQFIADYSDVRMVRPRPITAFSD